MASRRHWRFVVRDAYGFAIQNAKVYVYQPGTTTAFTGTAYDAASGGSVITNPFTTNAQGEVQGWFTDAQSVDVLVTDNTGAAYRAVDGAGQPVTFTSFTEVDELHVTPADDASSVGVAGDLVTALVDVFTSVTAVAGATGKYADAAHKHPFTSLATRGKTAKFTTTSDVNEQVVHTRSVGANTLVAGAMFRIKMKGYQTNGTTACTYTFRARWGGVAGVIVGQALALVGTTTVHTDNPVDLEFLMTVQSIGVSGTATGSWDGSECVTTATANTPKLVLDVQNAAATIDTTAAKDLVLTVQMSTVTGTPNLEVDNVLIEQVA